MTSPLPPRVCIVTGASSGLGRHIAVTFALQGACVTFCGRDPERLQETFKLCVEAGGDASKFLSVRGDVTCMDHRHNIVQHTVERWGRVDVLVPCAGEAWPEDTVESVTPEVFSATMSVHVSAPLFLVQECLPHLTSSRGCVCLVSSNLSRGPFPGALVYSMAKAAVDHMTASLAVALGPQGVRVNAVNPGFIPSRLTRNHVPEEQIDEKNQAINEDRLANTPLRSDPVTVDTVSQAVMFLCSAEPRGVTGQCLVMDGGHALSGLQSSRKVE